MDKRPRTDDDPLNEESKITIGRNRFVDVSKYKGKMLVNIREYYTDETGEWKPGRKGIALKLEEWEELWNNKERVDEMIAGVTRGRL